MITHWCKANVIKNYKLESLKMVLTGGAKLTREIMIQFRKSIPHVMMGQGYGMIFYKGSESQNYKIPNFQE